MLLLVGPAGIRLQEVAAQAGLSHPTVLHHFGNREGLVEAVVARALDSLHAGLAAAMTAEPKGPDEVAELLERVFATLSGGGHARAVLWLALEGYGPTMDQLHVRELATLVHETRCTLHKARHAALGKGAKKTRMPTFEDTYFTVLLPALALLSMSVMEPSFASPSKKKDEECGSLRFREWLARRIHEHLQES
jgi:AcrR family transcriptional regulator